MWKQLSKETPKHNKHYKVRLLIAGEIIEDSLWWTGKASMWHELKVDQWYDH